MEITRSATTLPQSTWWGVYMQDQIKLSEHWQAVVGLRHDHFMTNFDGIRRNPATNSAISEKFNVSDTVLSPRAGLFF